MMNYELAKKLKDAGFPQEYTRGSWACPHGIHEEMDYVPCLSAFCWGDALSYAPTLEELIEACGDKFSELVRTYSYSVGAEPAMWQAYMTEGAYHDMGGDCVLECCGFELDSTPSEAVAKLWLTLQTNKTKK